VYPCRRLKLESVSVGVGHNEQAGATVRRSNVESANREPDRIVPERGKVPENSVDASRGEIAGVLHDNESRSKLANDPSHFAPQAAASTREARSFGVGDVLTGEPPADEIDGFENCNPN